jgi:hypothetical protein
MWEGKQSKRGYPQRTELKESNLARIGIPADFWEQEIEDFIESEEKDIVSNYIENIHDKYEDGISLTFYGDNGSGN